MLRQTVKRGASLRYRRPYWMLFLKGVDNWKIYTVIQQADHQRTEMLYQAWLGGLDRPYVRPKCMAHQPLWLSKKRHMMQRARLEGAETSLESYVLEWHKKFHSFQGTERPTVDDLHTALDLVERPLDLSYACQLLSQCRNYFNICLSEDSFTIFVEACLRVDRKDCVQYAVQHADELGFAQVDANCRRYAEGLQSWYKLSPLNNLYYPLEDNVELNKNRHTDTSACTAAKAASSAATYSCFVQSSESSGAAMKAETGSTPSVTVTAEQGRVDELHAVDEMGEEIGRLEAELAALEAAARAECAVNDTSTQSQS